MPPSRSQLKRLAEPRAVVLKGAVDEEGFDQVTEDGQPEDEAETFFVRLVAEAFLTGDGSWPAAEECEDVQSLLGNAVTALLLRSPFVDAVNDERSQTHDSVPGGANDDRSLTHGFALISSDANSCGQPAA